MKICVISAILPPYTRGGAESVAWAAMMAFPEHEVFAISAEPFQSWRSLQGHWDKIDGYSAFRIFRFAPANLFSIFDISKHNAIFRLFWHVLDMFNWHTYFVVRRVLRNEKPDLIITHNLKGLGYTVPLAIRRVSTGAYRPTWLHTIHDLGAIHPTGLKIYGKENSFAQTMYPVRLYARINSRLFGSPYVVISPSEFLLKEYREIGFFAKSKTAIIRNPVFDPKSSTADKKSPPPFKFLYLGQLEWYKGLSLLLEAWPRFFNEHRGAELIIAGNGSLKSKVEKNTKTLAGARYVGYVQDRIKDEILSDVHYLILPSLTYENSPTSIGESFLAGAPVIASKIGGIPELVEDGVNGFLFQPNDDSSLLGALKKAVSTNYKILQQGALRSAPNFSLEKYHDQIISLFNL